MEILKNACKIFKIVLTAEINGKKYIQLLQESLPKITHKLNGISI